MAKASKFELLRLNTILSYFHQTDGHSQFDSESYHDSEYIHVAVLDEYFDILRMDITSLTQNLTTTPNIYMLSY